MNGKPDFDPRVVAELMAARWKENRSYYTLKQRAGGVWLEAAWERESRHSALELHWSRAAADADRGAPRNDQRL